MYYSNEDLENFYVRYKAEGLPRKISIQEYCLRNKVPWNLFNKWYRDTRHRIEEVTVIGLPEAHPGQFPPGEVGVSSPSQESVSASSGTDSGAPRITVDIRMSNGLHVFQKNLSYRKLLSLVGNLEALC